MASFLVDLDDLALPHQLVKKSVQLGSFSRTIALVSYLLDSFSPKATLQAPDKRQSLDLRQNLSGVLNGFNRVRKIIVRWLHERGSRLDPGEENVPIQFLAHVYGFTVSKSTSSAILSDVSLTSAWLQCLNDLVEPSITHGLSSLQGEISKYLDEVSGSVDHSKLFEEQSRDLLLPILVEIEHGEQNDKPIETCLVVRASRFSKISISSHRLTFPEFNPNTPSEAEEGRTDPYHSAQSLR